MRNLSDFMIPLLEMKTMKVIPLAPPRLILMLHGKNCRSLEKRPGPVSREEEFTKTKQELES